MIEAAKRREVRCGLLLMAFLAGAFPSAGETKPAVDNERVRVWDVTLTPGQPAPLPRDTDVVTMFLVGGKIRTTDADGKSSVAQRSFGNAAYYRKGSVEKIEVVSDSPARVIVIEMKDHPSPDYPKNAQYPPAFPRAGSKKIIENERMVVWNYTWLPNQPTPMHYHDKDALVIYHDEGSVKSTTPDGKAIVNNFKFGSIRFNPGNRVHSELLVDGRESAMMMELK